MTGTRSRGVAAGLAALLAACGGWGDVSSSELDLSIQAAYVTQGTQDLDGTVPLVQGRDGWIRVLVTANQPNNAWPLVRATLLEGGVPVATLTIPPPSLVPFETSERSMTQTWNVRLPGTELKAGRSLLVELDPIREYADRDRANNAWPRTGAPLPLDVRIAPPLEVKFVPIAVTSYSGNSTWANIGQADLDRAAKTIAAFLPVSAIVTSLHAPVGTSIDLGSEMSPVYAAYMAVSQLRAVEQPAGSTIHYVGVLPWAAAYWVDAGGLGELDGFSVAVWDYGFDAGEPVVPHELGHNFGLLHTPCAPAWATINWVDPAWPTGPSYVDAHLGVWGLDVEPGTPKDPAAFYDLMSYCTPVWISDYSYHAALELREAAATATAAALPALAAAPGPGLLLSGSFDSQAGAALGEPLMVEGSGATPVAGRDAIEALDTKGAILFAVPFTARTVADSAGAALEAFGFTVPIADEMAGRITALRWTRDGALLASRSVARIAAPARDPATGELTYIGPMGPRMVP